MYLRSESILFDDSPKNARAGYFVGNRTGVLMQLSPKRKSVTQFDDNGKVVCHRIIRAANDNR